MAIITKITAQIKNKERYNIFLDGQYAFSVDEAVLITFQLRKGLELNKEKLEKIIYEDHIRKSYGLAINYLSYRMRSTKEIIDYLKKKEVEEPVIEIIIARLMENNYINDLEFAKAFVRSRIQLTTKGPNLIRQELMSKGIASTIIEESLKLYLDETQLENATKLVEKKLSMKGKISTFEQKKKLYGHLLSKGYNEAIIETVLRQKMEENNESQWQAIVYQGEKALRKCIDGTTWEKKMKVKQYLYRKGFPFELIEKFVEEFVKE